MLFFADYLLFHFQPDLLVDELGECGDVPGLAVLLRRPRLLPGLEELQRGISGDIVFCRKNEERMKKNQGNISTEKKPPMVH